MNKRITKKLFKQKLYGLKDNNYIVMRYDIKTTKVKDLNEIMLLLNQIVKNNIIAIPNEAYLQSMSKEQVKQIRDKLTEIVGD